MATIGKSARVKGRIHGNEDLTVFGRVEGEVNIDGDVVIEAEDAALVGDGVGVGDEVAGAAHRQALRVGSERGEVGEQGVEVGDERVGEVHGEQLAVAGREAECFTVACDGLAEGGDFYRGRRAAQ